jgi:hypothetical protein
MSNQPSAGQQAFDYPAIYQIQIQGRLDSALSPRLEGMDINGCQIGEGMVVTTLVGELPDQAALAGVLATLYGMHLTVLSVIRLAAGPFRPDSD